VDPQSPARRERQRGRLRAFLERHRSPRLMVCLMVAATGAAGLLATYLMLRAGLIWPVARWPLTVLLGYGAFLLLVRLWVAHEARRGTVTRALGGEEPEPEPFPGARDRKGSSGDGIDLSLDGDEGTALLLLLIAAVVALGAGVYVVVIAPELLTEVLLDAAVSAGLYHRLRGTPGGDWLTAAWRRTRTPFLLVLVFFALAGLCVQWAFPGAHSLREVIRHLTP
jgi:hypothetical protein